MALEDQDAGDGISVKEEDVYQILIVDDEKEMQEVLKETLKAAREFECSINTAGDGKEGLDRVKKKDYDVILSDYKMPNMDGIEFLKKVRSKCPDALRIMITGHGDLTVAKEAINEADIHQYLEKPVDKDELRHYIYQGLERKKVRESKDTTDVNTVEEALETVEKVQKNITHEVGKVPAKESFMLVFESGPEFNKFSFEMKDKDNVDIEDVHVFENKYIINIGVYPKSIGKIQ